LRLKSVALCSVLLTALVFSWGCGKKAPPFAPKANETVPLRVAGLEATEQGGRIVLSGMVALLRDRHEKQPVSRSCRVYHVWYPADNPPCEGCPISFTTYGEVTPHISGDGRFQCDTGVKAIPGMHYFMVRLVDSGDLAGAPSDRAKLLIQ
jgi:hypothetical protein